MHLAQIEVFFRFFAGGLGGIGGRYKVTAFGLWFLFWLHQWGIPHRMCRFNCSLRGHQRTKEMDSAEPLSSMEPRLRGSLDSTSSPRGIRCGGAYLLPRVWGNIVSLYPVQVDNPQFRMLCSYLCSALYRSRFSRVVGLWSHVFHYWGEGLFVPAATLGFAMVYSWICADRDWGVCLGG